MADSRIAKIAEVAKIAKIEETAGMPIRVHQRKSTVSFFRGWSPTIFLSACGPTKVVP